MMLEQPTEVKDLISLDQYLVESHFKEITNLNEKELNPYQRFFQEMLDKWGIKSIGDLENSQKSNDKFNKSKYIK